MSNIKDVSQSGEISILSPLLSNHPFPLVVDVGANDGLTYSNSRTLIECGWAGILIEPNPHSFKKLKELYDGWSSKVMCVECAASNSIGSTKLYADHEGMEGRSLGSTIDTSENQWSNTVIDRSSFVEVKTDVLANIISSSGFKEKTFGVLSVDTEGHDLEVLEGLGHYRPSVIITERNVWDFELSVKKQALLSAYGYFVAHHIGCNEIYLYSKCEHLKKNTEYIASKMIYVRGVKADA